MAEYNTYKCDICGELDAIHLVFPQEGLTQNLDLCGKCLPERFKTTVSRLDMSIQRFMLTNMGKKK